MAGQEVVAGLMRMSAQSWKTSVRAVELHSCKFLFGTTPVMGLLRAE